MQIAIFHELPKTSGSRKSVDKITQYLAARHKVDLYYVDKKPSYMKGYSFNKIFFYKFLPIEWKGGNPGARLYRDTIELIKLFFLHYKISKDIRRKKYDVVFIHGSSLTESPFLLLFKSGFKVYYAHAPNYTLVFEKVMGLPKKDRVRYAYELVNRYIRKVIDKLNVKSADLILANSDYTKKKIRSFYGKKSIVSYLGVDTSIYKPLKTKKMYDFLFVGSYHPVDGYGLLQEAIGRMRKKPNGKVLAIENEWIDDDRKMVKLYNNSKVVLCLSYGEPFGLVAIEAMACGVPVIAVDEAGYKETVVHGKTGVLIKRSPEALRRALRTLLQDDKKRASMAANARRVAAEKWSWRIVVKRMESILERRANKYEN